MFKEYDEEDANLAPHIIELLNILDKENAEIATFLGIDVSYKVNATTNRYEYLLDYGDGLISNVVPNYKKNWDSLMQVVSAVNETACVEIGDSYCSIKVKRDGDAYVETDLEDFSSSLEMVYHAILNYVQIINIQVALVDESSKVTIQVLTEKTKPEKSGLYVCYQKHLLYYNASVDTWTDVKDTKFQDSEVYSWENKVYKADVPEGAVMGSYNKFNLVKTSDRLPRYSDWFVCYIRKRREVLRFDVPNNHWVSKEKFVYPAREVDSWEEL